MLPGSTDSLTLHLQAWPRRADAEGGNLVGSYAAADGHPYELYSDASPAASPDSLTLREYSPEHAAGPDNANGPVWRLRRQGRALVGTVNGQPVTLREIQPAGSVRFVARYFQDSTAAFPKLANTPYARQSLLALLPVNAPKALQENLLRGLRSDTLDTTPTPQLAAYWQQQRQQYARDYRQDVAGSAPTMPEDTADTSAFIGLSYDEQQQMRVLWNEAPLLSIGYYGYSYTGGAHGSYGTQAATFDTRSGRRLRYADLFRAGTDAELAALLDRAVRRTFQLAPTARLDELLMVEKMPVTRNVFLTRGGAVFVYSPYEIASYAQGEIRVFVPLGELRPLLRPGLPVAGGGEVSVP